MHGNQMKSDKNQGQAQSHPLHRRIAQKITGKVRMGKDKVAGPWPPVHRDGNHEASHRDE
ncbi:hypothetical protein D3C75_1384540 [compost metagenome]